MLYRIITSALLVSALGMQAGEGFIGYYNRPRYEETKTTERATSTTPLLSAKQNDDECDPNTKFICCLPFRFVGSIATLPALCFAAICIRDKEKQAACIDKTHQYGLCLTDKEYTECFKQPTETE